MMVAGFMGKLWVKVSVLISPSFDLEWAALQLDTTANFGRRNIWLTWFSGFPKVSHTHYPEISAILKNTAEEFHLPYHEYPIFTSALKNPLRHLNEPPLSGKEGKHLNRFQGRPQYPKEWGYSVMDTGITAGDAV
jgi:hypothetical protein